MSNKRRVMVTIHHRGRLSLRENWTRLGRSAYHWGILIQPKNPKDHDSNAFDVSDGMAVDPITHRDLNPNLEWNFRAKTDASGSLLGKVMIGKVPNKVKNNEIESRLREVPLPIQDTAQNCVTWTMAAIQVLQNEGMAENLDVDQFMAKALGLADEWLRNQNPESFHNYTNRVL